MIFGSFKVQKYLEHFFFTSFLLSLREDIKKQTNKQTKKPTNNINATGLFCRQQNIQI